MPSPNYITDLSNYGLLEIAGEGAKKLLQGQLTCNLDEITLNQSRLGALCNPQGRMISLFRTFMLQDRYYLQMPREMVSITLNALKKYAVFFKVMLQDVSENFSQMGVYGQTDLIPLPTEVNTAIPCDDFIVIKPDNLPRYFIIGTHIKITFPAELSASQQWKIWDLSIDLPAIYPETSEKFLPQEINLDKLGGISFNKGCYTGQEIIARMHYRGKLKKQLQHATIHAPTVPIRGAETEDGAIIVDYAKISDNNYEILIII